MLFLVFAYGHMGCLIQQDVRCLQHRIGEEGNARAFAVLAGFIFELCHAIQPAHAGRSVQQPLQFGMSRYLSLIEQDRFIDVEAAGNQRSGHFPGVRGQLCRIMRHRQGVQIREEIERFHFILHLYPIADGTQIIAEMKISRWLDAGNDTHILKPLLLRDCYDVAGD